MLSHPSHFSEATTGASGRPRKRSKMGLGELFTHNLFARPGILLRSLIMNGNNRSSLRIRSNIIEWRSVINHDCLIWEARGAYHLSGLHDLSDRSVRKCSASVLRNWELLLAKLPLLWKSDHFSGPKELTQFGRTDAFHLWTTRSGQSVLTNGKCPRLRISLNWKVLIWKWLHGMNSLIWPKHF